MADQKTPTGPEAGRDPEMARLWRQARAGWVVPGPTQGAPQPDANSLAAYLDDRLDESMAEAVEAWLLDNPEAVELVAASRGALAERPLAPPAALIARARGLVRQPAAGARRSSPGGFGGILAVLFPVRRLGFAATFVALVMASYGSFTLGQVSVDQASVDQAAAFEATLAEETSFDLASAFEDPLWL